ncbi:hypothetical protein EG68_02965 [Paragonimus skrjabini miyazakii]|uniref:Ig-like domain-containing protein n=1 Tax=Paragonimus skrjabini miyazakii TaxID=59628 RepID=A0A8S9Z477_9TREM|nr:hypothetical protein EG68_02965 [Paragonimus skrjabini miyazakii]
MPSSERAEQGCGQLGIYVDYANNDYGNRHTYFQTVLDEKDSRLQYVVDINAHVKYVCIIDVERNASASVCVVGGQPFRCCLEYAYNPMSSYEQSGCDFVLYATWGGQGFHLLTLRIQKESFRLGNLLIWFYIHTPLGHRHYFSEHPNRSDRIVCPQFATHGHTSSSEAIANELNGSIETHLIEHINSLNDVGVMEQELLYVRVCGFATQDHEEALLHITYQSSLNEFALETIHSDRMDISTGEQFENAFTLRMQWHSKYAENIRFWNHTFKIGPNSVALIFLIYRKDSRMEVRKKLTGCLRNWLDPVETYQVPEWDKYVQSPAVRMIRLFVKRTAIFQEGQEKLFYLDNQYRLSLVCYKRHNKMGRYKLTTRMIVYRNKPYVGIRNLTVEDSGLYMCKTSPGTYPQYELINDYYIIVLPRHRDIQNYLTTRPLDPKDELADNYPYVDVLDLAYFVGSKPIYFNCVYLLHKGLDNFNGMDTSYETNFTTVPQLVFNFSREVDNFVLHVYTFEIRPEYDEKVMEIAFHCIYHYKQDTSLVHDYRMLPDSVVHLAKIRRAVALRYNVPQILTSTIQSSQSELTSALKQASYTMDSMLTGVRVTRVRVSEGQVRGKFIALLNEQWGWISVFLYTNVSGGRNLLPLTCASNAQKVSIQTNDSLRYAEEVRHSYTNIAKSIEWGCVIVQGAEAIVLSVNNPRTLNVDQRIIEDRVREEILLLLLAKRMNSNVTTTGMTASELTLTSFKLVHLDVKWQATIIVGSTARMLFKTDAVSSIQVICVYSVSETSPWEVVNIPYHKRQFMDVTVFEVYKPNVTEQDSGLYHCRTCTNCSELDQPRPRRLVVLPDLSRLHLQIDYGSENYSGTGTFDDPVLTNAKSMTVLCSYFIYHGLSADMNLTVIHETALPKKHAHAPLRSVEKSRVRETMAIFDRLTVSYHVYSPSPHEYWNYTRINCTLVVYNITRDPFDNSDAVPDMTVTKSLYFSYYLTREPVLLPVFIQTTSNALTDRLRLPQSSNITVAFSDENLHPVQEVENSCIIDYVVFLGMPRGWTDVWIISSRLHQKTPFVSECLLLHSETIDDPNLVPELSDSEVYRVNMGFNFQRLRYQCVLDINTVGVILIGFGKSNKHINVTATEKLLKSLLVRRFKPSPNPVVERAGVDLVDTDLINFRSTSTIYRLARLHMLWTASVNVGQSATLLGYSSSKPGDLHCFYRARVSNPYVHLSFGLKVKVNQSNLGVIKMLLYNVSYMDSGLYMCNTSQTCANCSSKVGIDERQLVVLPNSDILSMHLNLEPLRVNETSVARFNQCLSDGTPFLIAEQVASVRCIHTISPSVRLQPDLQMLYEMYYSDRRVYTSLAFSQGVHFDSLTDGELRRTVSYSIRAPDALTYRDHLRVTCRLTYRVGHIANDINRLPGVFDLSKTKQLIVKISAAPQVFFSRILSSTPELLASWQQTGILMDNEPISAMRFHLSTPEHKITEDVFHICSIQALGVPPGKSKTWLIYHYDKIVDYEDCLISELQFINRSTIPADLYLYTSYMESGARNFVNITFVCTVQPHHIALVFVAYNTLNELIDLDAYLPAIADQLLDNVRFWLAHPTSEEERGWPTISDLRGSYGILRLNIGWQSSVSVGSPWRILIRNYRSPNVQLQIYHQDSPTSPRKKWLTAFSRQNGTFIGHEHAELKHAGIYSCQVESPCDECKIMQCFFPRRLLVTNIRNFLSLYLSRRLLGPNETIVDDFPKSRLKSGEEIFVYCVYLRRRGFTSNERLLFQYQLLSDVSDRVKILAYTEERRQQRTSEDGTTVIVPFRIVGAISEGTHNILSVRCLADLDEVDLDPTAMDNELRSPHLSVVRKIQPEIVTRPIVFQQLVKTSNPKLTDWLRNSLTEATNPIVFHQTWPPSPFAEALVNMEILASLGVPRGWIGAVLFLEHGQTMIVEPCLKVRQLNQFAHTLPSGLLHDARYDTNHQKSLVAVTFRCPLRCEDFALAIIACTSSDLWNETTAMTESTINMITWLKQLHLQESRAIEIPPKNPSGILVSYTAVKLRIGWEAFKKIGDRINLLGYVGSRYNQIACYLQYQSHSPLLPLSRGFQIIRSEQAPEAFELVKTSVMYNDSALYSCSVNVSNCPRCDMKPTIIRRRLVVIPDESVVSMFLTHDQLDADDEWVGNFDTCDVHNRPFMYMGTVSHAHCVHLTEPSDWLKLTFQAHLYAINNQNETERLPYDSPGPISRTDGAVLHTIGIRLHRNRDYGILLQVHCVWEYTLPELLPVDLQQTATAVVLNRTRTITVRDFIKPSIHNQLADVDDSLSRSPIRNVKWETHTATVFHSKAYTIIGSERVIRMHVLITLGVPMGVTTAWTMYQYNKQLYREDCLLEKMISLTDRNIPDALKHVDYRPDVNENVVNVSWVCMFRPEHIALFIVTHSIKHDTIRENQAKVLVDSSLSRILQYWLDNPKSAKQIETNVPTTVSLVYRAIRISVTWPSTINLGKPIRMLGYARNVKEVAIHCFQKLDEIDRELPAYLGFHILARKDYFGFELVKTRVQFEDSAEYSCRIISNTGACTNCTDFRFGFTPRRLTVRPDNSVLKIYLSHKQTEPSARNFTQYTKTHQPYLLCGEGVFVYCSYLNPLSTKAVPKHWFQTHMINSRINRSIPQAVFLVKEIVTQRTTCQVISQVYHIRAPLPQHVIGPFTSTCVVQYPDHADVNLTSHITIEIQVRVRPTIFEDSIFTSRSILTDALRTHLHKVAYTAGQFRSGGPDRMILEGTVIVNYTVGLGLPQGWSSVDLLSWQQGRVRRRPCNVLYLNTNVTQLLTSHSISSSEYALESRGQGLVTFTVACPVTIDAVAMVLVVMNYVDSNLSALSTQLAFYTSLYHTVERWLNETQDPLSSSASFSSINIPPQAFAQYSLFHLRVGWRAHIPAEAPIVMVGMQNANDLKGLLCFHQGFDSARANRTLFWGPQTFLINRYPHNQTFELIKVKAAANDSGVYECFTRRCIQCSLIPVLIPHRLFVISRYLKLQVHYGRNKATKHTTDHVNWFYTQYSNHSRPFIYSTQAIGVTCDYHIVNHVTALPKIYFRAEHIVTSVNVSINLPHQLLGTYQTPESDYLAVHATHSLTCPDNVSYNDVLNITCELRSDFLNETFHDINGESKTKPYLISNILDVRRWINPLIISESIQSDDPTTTVLFQTHSASKSESLRFLRGFSRAPLTEGRFLLKFACKIAQPQGWYGAVSIYNRSHAFHYRTCIFEYDYYWRENLDRQSRTEERLAYTCFLLPEHVGILIYAAHSPEAEINKMQFEKKFLTHITLTVRQWFNGRTQMTTSIPAGARGDYRLIPIPVSWKSIVNIGDSVVMYGLMDEQLETPPTCFYGYRDVNNPLKVAKQFMIKLHPLYRYFELSKLHVKLTDSGMYACTILDCSECSPVVGFNLRTMRVQPDESIIHLHLNPVPIPGTWDSSCPTGFASNVAPNQTVNVKCSHLVALGSITNAEHIIVHGLANDPTTNVHMEPLSRTVEEGPVDSVRILSSGKIQAPTFAELNQIWSIQCRLPYSAVYPYSHKMQGKIPKYLITEARLTITHKHKPRIIKHSVRINGQFTDKGFQNTAHYPLTVETFLRSAPIGRVDETTLEVAFTAYAGIPFGWTFVRTYYHKDGRLFSDRCASSRILNESDPSTTNHIEHISICSIQLEHVAVLIAAINLPEDVASVNSAESQLELAVLSNVSKWLGYNSTESPFDNQPLCFYHDLRLLRLKVGWKATVNVGQAIVMQGRFGGRKLTSINCFHRKIDTNKIYELGNSFELKRIAGQDKFLIMKPKAAVSDMGVYFCNSSYSDNTTVYVGMQPRKLTVLPMTAQIQCDLTLDPLGKKSVKENQKLAKDQVYLYSNQVAYLHCVFQKNLSVLYDSINLATYSMQNNVTGKIRKFKRSKRPILLTEETDNEKIRKIYQIISPNAQEYVGPLRVSCLSVFENLTSTESTSGWNGSIQIGCHRWFTILEEANGVLDIKTLSDNYQIQPVPMGSEFLCTGGYGIPKLTYSWTRVRSGLYGQDTMNVSLPSLLPGDGGGWGGPTRPFLDMPTRDLETDGPLLRVPKDPAYRGMSYLYLCTASNIIHNVRYTIRKEIYFTVLICPTDRVRLDLSILNEPRLLSGCKVLGSTYSDIQHYGYFHLTLIRQVLLGLPFGSDRTRFSFIYRTKEAVGNVWRPNMKVKYNRTKFASLLSRRKLAEELYSPTRKPASGTRACASPWIDLWAVVREVNTLYEQGFTRNPVFWLTVDYFVKVENASIMLNEMRKLQKYGIKIILSFMHPLNGTPYEELNERLIRILQPMQYMNLLPYFEGTTTCQTCQLPIQSNRAKIQRGEVFDAICQAADSRPVDPIEPPRLTYSVSKKFWFHGTELLVTCTETPVVAVGTQMLTELVMCLTNEKEISRLFHDPPLNVQRLRHACHHYLCSESSWPAIVNRQSERHSVTVSVTLRSNDSNPLILCYQRLGENEPKVFDAVNFTYASIASTPSEINQPALYITNRASIITSAIRFRCEFLGYTTNLEVLLLLRSHGNHSLTSQSYMVVARTKPKLHLDSGLTRAVLLLLEFPVNALSGELICLVQPLDSLNKSVRKLNDLPTKSALVKYSSPISMPKIAGTCPVAPKLFTNETVSKTGGLRTFHCVSRISSRYQAVKLYYLTPTLTIILCVPKTETLFFKGLPCILVSGIDRDCSVVKPVNASESLSYVHSCSISSLKNDNASSHTIYFSILRLRTHDFRGQVFCETLDLLTLGSPEESKIRAKLVSDVITLRFPLEPQILSFIFDPSTQRWECRVAGYPLHGRAHIQMVRVRPMWLGKQMEMYINTLNRTQPSVQQEHLVPPEAVLEAKQLEYTIGVSHRPIIPLIGGLTNGIVELRCKFQGASGQISTKIGISADPYESLVPESPTLKVGDVLNTVCTITAPMNGSVVHMSLHRMIYSEWAIYDVAVISVTFETDEQSFFSQGLDNIQHKFDLLGLWAIGYHSAHVRVLTDQTGRSRSIDISVLSSVVSSLEH